MTLQILPLRVRSLLSWACDLYWLTGCNESDVVVVLSSGHKDLALFCAFVLGNPSPPYAWAWEPAWGESVCMSAQWCLTLCDPLDCSPPRSSVHGIFQARILEWVAISCSRGSSWSRDQPHISWVSCIGRWILYYCATWKALKGRDHIQNLWENQNKIVGYVVHCCEATQHTGSRAWMPESQTSPLETKRNTGFETIKAPSNRIILISGGLGLRRLKWVFSFQWEAEVAPWR